MRYGNSRKNISHNACYLKISYTKQQTECMKGKTEGRNYFAHTKFSLEPQNIHMRIMGWVEKSSQKKKIIPLCRENKHRKKKIISGHFSARLWLESLGVQFFWEVFNEFYSIKRSLIKSQIHIKYKVQCKIN